ncbi:unnamed protein product, partial [Vitis vinifera]|uniref:Uncharacterized protein n=1 Tax=Vitis vinifera TaxID=29760 RepID=E0CTH2_VITVI
MVRISVEERIFCGKGDGVEWSRTSHAGRVLSLSL